MGASKRAASKAMKLTKLAKLLRTRDEGNVAIVTAAAMIPLAIASMGAVDLTRAYATRVELQDALDAAALAAGRSSTSDQSKLQALGERILDQNLASARDFTLVDSSFSFGPKGEVVASATASFAPMLGGLAGGDGTREVTVSTEVKRANSMLEIALVLDNTQSMDEMIGSGKDRASKISFLKTAATSFIDSMSNAASQSTTPNSIKIAIVPFSNLVNVGSTYKTADWLDKDGKAPINNGIFTIKKGVATTAQVKRLDLFTAVGTSWGGCVEMRQAPYDIQDTAPDSLHPETLFTPFFAPDEADGVKDSRGRYASNDYVDDPTKDDQGKKIKDNYSSEDREWVKQGSVKKYDKANRNDRSFSNSVGPNATCNQQAITRLSTNFNSLKSAVNSMTTSGNTNIPMGLIWGWHAVSPYAPFGDGVAYHTDKYKKVVVLMTDGENTMASNDETINGSMSSAAGYMWQGRILDKNGDPETSVSAATAAMNDRLKKLCTNMKAADKDILIYVVAVGVTGSNRDMLKACASEQDFYFDATDGAQLTGAFQTIANQISALHLSK
jgi:Flp pilus assembly protein TadG